MAAPNDKTINDLLIRHSALVQAPIPLVITDLAATMHMLNRCGNLLVDLLQWRHHPSFPAQLYDELQACSQQHEVSGVMLQLQLAVLLQQAI